MRAVVATTYGGPDVLEMSDVPAPEPGPGEVTIAVEAAGVGLVDTLLRSGRFDLLAPPFVPGIEVAGRIASIGDGVCDLAVGQRAAALLNDFFRGGRAGGYAELARARADLVAPVPETVTPAEAAGLAVNATTALLALQRAGHLRPADVVVVLGASSGVGGEAAGVARALGAAHVIGIVSSEGKRTRAREYGCTEVVVARDPAENRHLAALRPDVVVDPVGGALRRQLIGQLAPLGRYVVVGDASSTDTTLAPDSLWHASTAVAGLSLGGIAHLQPRLVRNALTEALTLKSRGALTGPAPHVVPLQEAGRVHHTLEERSAPGKVVLDVGLT